MRHVLSSLLLHPPPVPVLPSSSAFGSGTGRTAQAFPLVVLIPLELLIALCCFCNTVSWLSSSVYITLAIIIQKRKEIISRVCTGGLENRTYIGNNGTELYRIVKVNIHRFKVLFHKLKILIEVFYKDIWKHLH